MHRYSKTLERHQMIPLFKVIIDSDVAEDIRQVMQSGYIGQGPKVLEFEQALKPRLGENVLTTNSGTSALHLALRLAGVGYDDEVISTPMTCTATNMPILERGGKIVWADIDPWTGNISVEDVRKKITSKTKALMCVHWGGWPCDLEGLSEIGQEYGIPVIQDAAHAFGAVYGGLLISEWSSFTCFSFQAIKHLTCIDGGALVCGDREQYDRGKLLRWYGIDRDSDRKDFRCEEDIAEYGYKFHMNDVNATVGLKQLQHIDKILACHRVNAQYYTKELSGLKKVKLLKYNEIASTGSYWLYTVRVDDVFHFMGWMKEQGITVSQVHVRNDKHMAFGGMKEQLVGVDDFCQHQVSIPVGSWLSEKDIEHIAESIKIYDWS